MSVVQYLIHRALVLTAPSGRILRKWICVGIIPSSTATAERGGIALHHAFAGDVIAMPYSSFQLISTARYGIPVCSLHQAGKKILRDLTVCDYKSVENRAHKCLLKAGSSCEGARRHYHAQGGIVSRWI